MALKTLDELIADGAIDADEAAEAHDLGNSLGDMLWLAANGGRAEAARAGGAFMDRLIAFAIRDD